jgi:hypothetical protein
MNEYEYQTIRKAGIERDTVSDRPSLFQNHDEGTTTFFCYRPLKKESYRIKLDQTTEKQ